MSQFKDLHEPGDVVKLDIGDGKILTGSVTRNLGTSVELETEVGILVVGNGDSRIVVESVVDIYNAAKV